jgi:hypothetical protein
VAKPFIRLMKTGLPERLAQGQRHSSDFGRRPTLTLVGELAEPLKGARYGERVSLRVSGIVSNATGENRQDKAQYSISIDEVERS